MGVNFYLSLYNRTYTMYAEAFVRESCFYFFPSFLPLSRVLYQRLQGLTAAHRVARELGAILV